MYLIIATYSELGALPRALCLFPLGLVIGSFSTMLRHRLPLRQSIVRPGSHCPACGHGLRAADLVPALSYLALRGRCRYCQTKIPVRYLLLELGCGLLAAVAGALGGWVAALSILCLIPVVVAGFSLSPRTEKRSQEGFALVEILVAVTLLVAVAVPMYQTFSNNYRGLSTYQRQYAISWATSYIEDIQARSPKFTSTSWPWTAGVTYNDGCRQVGGVWMSLDHKPTNFADNKERPLVQQETIVVTFWPDGDCGTTGGSPLNVAPVRMVAVIAKTP